MLFAWANAVKLKNDVSVAEPSDIQVEEELSEPDWSESHTNSVDAAELIDTAEDLSWTHLRTVRMRTTEGSVPDRSDLDSSGGRIGHERFGGMPRRINGGMPLCFQGFASHMGGVPQFL